MIASYLDLCFFESINILVPGEQQDKNVYYKWEKKHLC